MICFFQLKFVKTTMSSARALDLISPRVKALSAGMISRDRKERAAQSLEQIAQPAPVQPDEALSKMEMDSLQRVFQTLISNSKVPGKFGKQELEERFEILEYKPQKVTDFGLSECEVSYLFAFFSFHFHFHWSVFSLRQDMMTAVRKNS